MSELTWKVVAIIFVCLFAIESGFIFWIFKEGIREQENQLDCYYDVCEEYPNAIYEENLCTCYDYDVLGEYIIAKQEIMR